MTFEERLAALEARTITVADLPLKALQNKLEMTWQPEAAVLLQAGSVRDESITDATISNAKFAAPEALQTPTLAGAWVDFDANRPARYYRWGGRVFLSGMIKSGVIGTTAFTLPLGWRPASVGNILYACASNDAFGLVSITSGGVVTPAVGSNVYVALDGIHFRHA